jgi:hypothetical protein
LLAEVSCNRITRNQLRQDERDHRDPNCEQDERPEPAEKQTKQAPPATTSSPAAIECIGVSRWMCAHRTPIVPLDGTQPGWAKPGWLTVLSEGSEGR